MDKQDQIDMPNAKTMLVNATLFHWLALGLTLGYFILLCLRYVHEQVTQILGFGLGPREVWIPTCWYRHRSMVSVTCKAHIGDQNECKAPA